MSDKNRLLDALAALLPSIFPREPFLGPRKYRVVRMRPSAASANLTRVEIQIVTKATGLPDMLLVSPWPGLAGSTAELTPGSLVLVQFIDGDRQQPIVTHFSPPDDPEPTWRPVHLRVDATTSITIGAGSPPAAARVGDDVDLGKWSIAMVAGVPTITIVPPQPPHTPIVFSVSPTQLDGLISSGSSKVGIE